MNVNVACNRSVEEHRNFTFVAFPPTSLPDQFSLKFRVERSRKCDRTGFLPGILREEFRMKFPDCECHALRYISSRFVIW